MPTLYFACPQCDRPLDADPALDGPTVQCPCCDRVVEVPHPRALGRPVMVWLAAALTVLLPACWIPVLLSLAELLPPGAGDGIPIVVGFGTIACLLAAVALVRGKRSGWGAALSLGIAGAALGVAAFVFSIPFVLVFAMGNEKFLDGIVPALAGGVLLTLLLLPACRAWCDR